MVQAGPSHLGKLAETPKFSSKQIHFPLQGAHLEVCTKKFCLSNDVYSTPAHQVSFSQLCSEPASKCSTLQITLITATVFAFFQSPNNGLTILDCLFTLQYDNEIQNITAAQIPFPIFWVSLLIQRATVKCRERKKGTKASNDQKQASQ